MPKRNSPNDIQEIDDLTRIDEIVVDKRNAKRSGAKKGRRDRHYKNQLIKNALKNLLDENE
jgi:hypothetical protein